MGKAQSDAEPLHVCITAPSEQQVNAAVQEVLALCPEMVGVSELP